MWWFVFNWEILGPAFPEECNFSTYHLSIFADHAHPPMETLVPGGCDPFQQNDAPCHKAKMVQKWFKENNNEFDVLTWPPDSPDLNLVEHMQDVLDR